jgi:potassium-dependent mechanosensitive channel
MYESYGRMLPFWAIRLLMSGMLHPGRNPLHWCRIALIAVGLAGASAVAQQPPSPPSILPPVASSQAPAPKPADLDSFKTELDDIARSYKDDAQTEDSLAALRQRLAPLRDQIHDHAAALEPPLKLITERLAQLGAAPAGSEDATVAAERSRLTAAQSEADGALKQARLAAGRADELFDGINARRRQLFADRLFAHSANLFDPAFWRDVSAAVPAETRSLGGVLKSWAASARADAGRSDALAAFATLIAIAVGAWFGRHWARRFAAQPTPRRFDKALSALVILCTHSATAPAVIAAAVLVLRNYMLMPPQVAALGFGLAGAVAVAEIGRGVAIALFAPGEGARRIIPFADQAAESYSAK